MNKNELKPVYIHEANYSSSNEISLVDIAIILIRRKLTIALVFAISLASGVFYSLSQKETTFTVYSYETSIIMGHRTVKSKTEYFEPPTKLLADIQYIYIPQFMSNYGNKYSVTASSPSNSGIITLKTNSSAPDDANAIELLNSISNKAIADHSQYYDAIKSNLNNVLDLVKLNLSNTIKDDVINLSKAIETHKLHSNKTNLSQSYLTATLELTSLRNSSIIDKPNITNITTVESGKRVKIILAASIFGGLFAAIFAAFIIEFISKLKSEVLTRNNLN